MKLFDKGFFGLLGVLAVWVVIWVLVAMFVTGCAPKWVHPTASAQQVDRDNLECEMVAVSAAGPPAYVPGYEVWGVIGNRRDQAEFFTRCMRSKGYRQSY